jgi:1,4-dihydroxy-2-naphthoyl-CoA hydrolase
MAFRRVDMTEEDLKLVEGLSAFMRATGLHFEEVTDEKVTAWIDIGPEHHQPNGIVHGGVYTSAIEQAASFGASFAAPEGYNVVGVHNSTNFIRAISEGRVRISGSPIQRGRSQQLWEVRVTSDQDGSLIAIGQVRLANLAPRG